MKKPMAKKVLAAVTTAAMAMSAVACGSAPAEPAATDDTPAADETPAPAADTADEEDAAPAADEEEEEEISPYTVMYTDDAGNPIDLGGMEVIIRDWWSPEEPAAPTNDFEEARDEYRQWIQDTYNFTIKQVAISDWGSAPQDFVDYVTTGGDDKNYVFTLRNDPAVVSGMANGLMYDLATLDILDFSSQKFQANKLHDKYSKGDSIYCMFAGVTEPRTGVFFNKRLLTDAGIDPESIYDMQKDGTWTWDKFDELMGQCQRDTDNDGVDDVYGLTINESVMTDQAVFSNGGSYVGKDDAGMFYYNLEAPETQEALEWCVDMYTKYDNHDPEGAEWDYYKEEFVNGGAAFMVDQEYCGTPGNFLQDMKDEVGFVVFPKGPKASGYVHVGDDNPACIPACYDTERAEKIALAWTLYTDDVPGYEGYNGFLSTARSGVYDTRAVDETMAIYMADPANNVAAYHAVIPNLQSGPELTWSVGPNADISALTEAIAGTWQAYIEEANK